MDVEPVWWKCECGWIGRTDQMKAPHYNCPECDKFETVRVLVHLKMKPIDYTICT